MKSKDVFYGVIEFWNGTSYGFIKPDRKGDDSSTSANCRKVNRSATASCRPTCLNIAVTPGQVFSFITSTSTGYVSITEMT